MSVLTELQTTVATQQRILSELEGAFCGACFSCRS
jgi:hypothetical protein